LLGPPPSSSCEGLVVFGHKGTIWAPALDSVSEICFLILEWLRQPPAGEKTSTCKALKKGYEGMQCCIYADIRVVTQLFSMIGLYSNIICCSKIYFQHHR